MRYRLTGVGTPFVSLSFGNKDDDKEIARRAISMLEDRRILFADASWVSRGYCLGSAELARDQLTELIANPDISEGLARQLKLVRSYLRTFMTDAIWPRHLGRFGCAGHRRAGSGDDAHRYVADQLSVALGELRAKVGLVVGDLAVRFDLDVEPELATIIPVEDGGFFEQVLR